MKTLLVTSDDILAQQIELCLKVSGFSIYTTDLGEDAVDLGRLYDYDLIVMSAGLSDISGMDVLKSLRIAKIATPVLLLGSGDVEARVKAFSAGADDYVLMPFHKDELVARCMAVVRRSAGHANSVIELGNAVLNMDIKTLTIRGVRVHLTGKEFQLFELMALRTGSLLTKEAFLNHLYGGLDEPEIKIVDVFICKVRRKLRDFEWQGAAIETVWGRGYRLRVFPPAQAQAA